MIIDYKKYIMFIPNNKFIFAPNSSGKTGFSRSLSSVKNVPKENIYQLFKKENLKLIIKNEFKTLVPTPIDDNKNDWNLEIKNRLFLKINKDDVNYINSILKMKKRDLKIIQKEDEILIKELILKSGNSIFFLKNSEKLKNFTSSGEYELIILMILITSFFNLEKNIILDDPIEFASWENERIFIEFISYLLKKKSKTRIILLTHRFTLFSRFLGIYKKATINSIKPHYIYFIDDIPFWIDDLNSNFLTWNVVKELYEKNVVFKRIYLEEVYKKLYFKSIGEDINSKNLCDQQNKYVSDYKKATNDMKNNINFKINNDCSSNMSKFIDNKYNFINCLRNSILYDARKISKKEVNKLKNINISIIEKSKGWKKDYDKNIIEHIKNSLNSFLHPSNWIIWNEIDANKLIFLIRNNFNFVKWPKTKEVIEIMSDYLEKKKNIVKDQSSSYKDNFLE